MTRLVFVEGLPGSGKTSAAKHLARALRSKGFDASWFHELAPEHPVIRRSVMKQAAQDDFGQRCLDQWEAFVARTLEGGPNRSGEQTILEGCAFQSTVRFMYANRVSDDAIRAYWERFEKLIAPLAPRFVYLYQDEPAQFMHDRTLVRRGDVWLGKVAAYAEGTPRSRESGWRGRDGMVEFWLAYRELCDDLYERSTTCKLALENSAQFWSSMHTRIAEWVLDPEPPVGPGPGTGVGPQ